MSRGVNHGACHRPRPKSHNALLSAVSFRDESGYPNGISDNALTLEARMVGVADVVKAISSQRPYRAALGIDVGRQFSYLHDPSPVSVLSLTSCSYNQAMATRLLLVDNAMHRHLFKPTWHWKSHLKGIETRVVNLPSGQKPPDLTAFTHIILTGSEASIVNPKPWFETDAKLIREAIDLDIPILGSCFGHQMLVYALSGPQFVQTSNPPEVGWANIEMTGADPLFDDLPNPWPTFVYHFDEAVDPPAPWIKLGKTQHCDTHVLRFGTKKVWGIQAHPEISSRKAKFFIRATLLMGRKPSRHIFHALRHVPPPNNVADRILKRFLEQ